MKLERQQKWLIGALGALLFVLFAIIPSAGVPFFASPDETMYARTAVQLAEQGRASFDEPFAKTFSWLHPRSWVSQGAKIVPVGFLGWPWTIQSLAKVGGIASLPWAGSLLLLSAMWPLFQLLRRYGFWPAWIGTLMVGTFPSIILYANRGVFPNGPVLALAIWVAWLLQRFSAHTKNRLFTSAVIAILATLTLSWRPIEALWILPWWIVMGWQVRPTKKEWIVAGLGCLLILIPLLWLGRATYGTWFGVGYALRDSVTTSVAPIITQNVAARPWWIAYPFDVRAFVWNVWHFGLGLLWPWVLIIGSAIATFFFQEKKTGLKKIRPEIWVGAWMLMVLCLLYGGTAYADRLGPQIATLGNSFLRYLMPVAVLCGWGAAFLWSVFAKTPRTRQIGWIFVIFIALFGIYRATIADDEGVWNTRKELIKYKDMQAQATQWFAPGDLILSERSDKVFFPLFRAVSPLPNKTEIKWYLQSKKTAVGLFARPLSQSDRDVWRRAGLDLQEVTSFPRERLYRITLAP